MTNEPISVTSSTEMLSCAENGGPETEEAPAAAIDLMAALKASINRAREARGAEPMVSSTAEVNA